MPDLIVNLADTLGLDINFIDPVDGLNLLDWIIKASHLMNYSSVSTMPHSLQIAVGLMFSAVVFDNGPLRAPTWYMPKEGRGKGSRGKSR